MSITDWDRKEGFPEPGVKSGIDNLLRSHFPPPPNVSAIISILEDELEKYDMKIAQLKAELGRLESRRSALDRYHRGCRSLLAPIRRLPPEILLHIFQFCRFFEPDPPRFPWHLHSRDAVAHLAQKPLLRISQVCILWHTLVMGTTTLWNIVSFHSSALNGTQLQSETAMELLRAAFKRSGSLPLHVRFESASLTESDPYYMPALELITGHSARWESAKFMGRDFRIGCLSGVEGRLPLLRTLELFVESAAPENLEFLKFVPKLQNLTVYGSIEFCMPRLPLEGLVTYRCLRLRPNAVRWAVASLSRVSNPCDFSVEVDPSLWDAECEALGLRIPETSAEITGLSLKFKLPSSLSGCLQTFDQILAALTLPALRDLSFTATGSTLPWPHNQFIALSTRSSFHSHLLSLNLLDVEITEPELIQCLSTLPALQQLSFIDPTGPTKLIKNTFLSTLLMKLTRTSEDPMPLVPNLRILDCVSDLFFDDGIYLNFLLSRCHTDVSNGPIFVSRMRCQWHRYRRPLNADVAARIQEMCARGVLKFEWL